MRHVRLVRQHVMLVRQQVALVRRLDSARGQPASHVWIPVGFQCKSRVFTAFWPACADGMADFDFFSARNRHSVNFAI